MTAVPIAMAHAVAVPVAASPVPQVQSPTPLAAEQFRMSEVTLYIYHTILLMHYTYLHPAHARAVPHLI